MLFSPTLRAYTRLLLTTPISASFTFVSLVTRRRSAKETAATTKCELGRWAIGCSLVLSAFVVGAGTANAQSFSTPASYTVGSNPNWGVAGDFNADGKPDLAIGNVLQKNVSILLNNGDGTFSGEVNYAVDFNPEALSTADFNNDGKLDLAVGNFLGGPVSAGNISILLGNGNGTFQAAVNYDAGSPYNLAVADLNADGKVDLVAASLNTNKATVLLGNGNGTFQSAVTYATGTEPRGVAVADFNGDGKPDLAVTNTSSSNTSILLGNGNGTFQAATNYSTATSPAGVVASDLNGDARQDLVMAAIHSNAILVLLGNGNGTFQTPVSYAVGAEPQRLGLADFNGDTRTDVVVVNANSSSYSVLRGNGNGTFQTALTSPAKRNSLTPITSDFNTDGKPDLAIVNNGFNLVDVLLNSPSARGVDFTATETVSATVLVATFIDYDNSKSAGSFTASISWGDGTAPTAGTVSANATGGFNIAGSHTYAAAGTYDVDVQIADDSGNFATARSTATVRTLLLLSVNDVSINEGDSDTRTLTFTVTLSAASNLTVTVNFATANVTATAGPDYQAATGGLTFNPGDTAKTISVTIESDTINEVDETFILNISNPVNAEISRAQGRGTIVNDDAPVMLIDDSTGRALALDSVTQTRDPFSLINPHNLSSTDQRRRVSLFVWRLGLLPSDTVFNLTVLAEDDAGGVYQLTVEYVGAMAVLDGVTQVIVRLPDNVIGAPRDLSVTVQLRGPSSNKAVIKMAAP